MTIAPERLTLEKTQTQPYEVNSRLRITTDEPREFKPKRSGKPNPMGHLSP